MASFNIHLAIGKRYIEKNGNINNENNFYKGIIDPDLQENKKDSHYSGQQDKSNLITYLSKKVLLNEYLKVNTIETDYQKGIFLHLVTDYLFFETFFDKEYLKNVTYQDFCKDLYYSYDISNELLEKKYKLINFDFMDAINADIQKSLKEKKVTCKEGKNILKEENLDKFIEYVSNIDLDSYKNKIIECNKNVLP